MSGNKIKSNSEVEKNIEPIFDYGNITDRDKSVIEEVIKLIEQRPGVPPAILIAELKTKFQLVTIPMMKVEDSLWGQLTKDENLGQSMQGFRETVDKDGNKIRIPHIGFSADLDFLDNLINRIIKKANDMMK